MAESKEKEDYVARFQHWIDHPEAMVASFEKGVSFQEILHLPDELIEKCYQAARTIFERQNYEDAADAFLFLTTLNPQIECFWLGLGLSEQLMNRYEPAITAYNMCILIEPSNPMPHIHMAECFWLLEDRIQAINSLEKAIELSQNHPDYVDVYEEAVHIKNTIEKNL